jgi:FtsH-binding integral membrane protein
MSSAASSSSAFGVGSGFNFEVLTKTADLTPEVQTHLVKVYATLALTLVLAGAGVQLHLLYNVGGVLTTVLTFVCMAALGMFSKDRLQLRVALLAVFAVCQGASIGPLVALSLQIDPTLFSAAFFSTGAIFVSFSACALMSRRRSFLYLGGMLSSTVSVMLVMSVLNMFIGSSVIPVVQLYLGLAVFSAYVLYDTQMIIEKATQGNVDYVWHALELFIDFVAIFVRVLIILMRNSGKKKKNNSNQNGATERR